MGSGGRGILRAAVNSALRLGHLTNTFFISPMSLSTLGKEYWTFFATLLSPWHKQVMWIMFGKSILSPKPAFRQ